MSIVNLSQEFCIPINDVKGYNQLFEDQYRDKLHEILASGQYVLGQPVQHFEQALAAYVGVRYAVGVNSGTNALELAFELLALTSEDEVIIQANAYIACAFGALKSAAKLVIIDCDPNGVFDVAECQRHMTARTKAILVVHLYGDCCDMVALSHVCKTNGIFLVEDCAQALGSKYAGRMLGSFGDMACFSFYPSKNLGALGDAGAVCLNDAAWYDKLKLMRNLGSQKKYEHDIIATNTRLDTLQAAFLLTKFPDMDRCLRHKQTLASQYDDDAAAQTSSYFSHLRNPDAKVFHSYHLYVIKLHEGVDRAAFMAHMAAQGIETLIHYKIPFFKSKAFRAWNGLFFANAQEQADRIVSLPIYNTMTSVQVERVIRACRDLKKKN
jgi:dTDP-4-amino-4,6-dideoxygalactose transaminase